MGRGIGKRPGLLWIGFYSDGFESEDRDQLMSGSNGSMENKIECALPEVWRRKFQQSVDVCSKAIIPQAKKPTHIRIINCIGVKSDGSESTEFLYELAKMKATSVAVLYQNWRLMSTECQTGSLLPPVARSRVPWIFVPTADGAIFANFMGKRSLCATNGDMPHASLVYSRDGWLLFLSLSGEEKCDCQMVLMNPFSGETFTMPPAPLGLRCARPKASFTVREGRPDLVIYSCWVGRRNIQALLARPGEDEWQVHTASVLSQCIGLCDSLLCARKLYCVFDSGCRLMVFHLDGQYWSSYSVYLRGPYLVEFEGKVLSVCEPDGGGKFFVGELTVGENQAALVKLDDSELSNKSWFLGPVQSFCARMKGQRVYEFAYKPQWDGEDIGKKHYHVHYHDLLKKKFRYLTVDEFSSGHSWVDLGGVLVTRYPKTQA